MRGVQVTIRRQARIWLIPAILLCFASSFNSQEKKTTPPVFRVAVDTVYVKVTVADPLGRYVTGLEKEHFKIYEDNIEQTVLHFSQPSAPISVAILFDISGSMGFSGNIRIGKSWFAGFLKSSFLDVRTPEDEYSLITFNETVNLVKAFADDTDDMQHEVVSQKAGGWTALYDAVYRGLDHLKEARNEKKALIVISDGEENSSRYGYADVRELATESDVQIYGLGLAGPEGGGYSIINSLIRLTGGRAFYGNYEDLGYYFDLIHAELRTQYLLGYVPTNTIRDGKWRRIRVKIEKIEGLPKLTIRAKNGYYGPKN